MKMNSTDNKIYCPIVSKEIILLTCEDVSTSAEEMQPARFAPQEFRAVQNWKEICLTCKKHPE